MSFRIYPMPLKYRNTITSLDGIKFRSKKEAKRYAELKLLERAGEITNFELQPRFKCEVNNKVICTYVADFSYYEKIFGGIATKFVVEDVKGMKTPLYKLKKKLAEACFNIRITET